MKLTLLLCSFFLLFNALQAQENTSYYGKIGINYTSPKLNPEYHSRHGGAYKSTDTIDNYLLYPMLSIGGGYNLNKIKFKGKLSLELNFSYIHGKSDYYYYYYGKETNGQLFYRFINIGLQPTLKLPIKEKLGLQTGFSLNHILNINSYFRGTRSTYYEIHNMPFSEPIVYTADQDRDLPHFNFGLLLGMTYELNQKLSLYANIDYRFSHLTNDYYEESITLQSANIGLSYDLQFLD